MYLNILRTTHYVYNYVSSSNQKLMHHLSYTKLHCVTNTPTSFGARRRYLEVVLS